MSNSETLQLISNDTKDSIQNMHVVTPTVYASIFNQYASKHDEKIEDEHQLSQDILSLACENFVTLQNQTSQNALKLSNNTSKAISAIMQKDETTLNKVLQETKMLRQEIEQLKAAVYKDELTGAYNRKWMHDTLLQDDGTFKDSGTIALIDLNYFKIVNDTHGHIIGDKVLVFLTNQLKKTKYSVVRYGGDEFMILFSKRVPKTEVIHLLNNIREDIITKKLKAHENMFRVSFSFGISEFKKNDSFVTILEQADVEMYNDKIQIKERITGIEI